MLFCGGHTCRARLVRRVLPLCFVLAVGLLAASGDRPRSADAAVWMRREWLFLPIRLPHAVHNVGVRPRSRDERGPVTTLWAGRSIHRPRHAPPRASAASPSWLVSEPVPFGVVHEEGGTRQTANYAPLAPGDRIRSLPASRPGATSRAARRLSDLHGCCPRRLRRDHVVPANVLPRVWCTGRAGR